MHWDLHKIPASLLSPESCQLNSSLFPGGGISLLWLLKAILLSSLKSSCACAQRGHSQKEIVCQASWVAGGRGRQVLEWCSTRRDSQGFLGADRMWASQPHHCLLAIPAAEPLKLGVLAAATGSQQPGMHGVSKTGACMGCKSSGLSPGLESLPAWPPWILLPLTTPISHPPCSAY